MNSFPVIVSRSIRNAAILSSVFLCSQSICFVLYGERRGAKLGDDARELVVYLAQAACDGLVRLGCHAAVRAGAAHGSPGLYDAPARVGQAGVNPKDYHRRASLLPSRTFVPY